MFFTHTWSADRVVCRDEGEFESVIKSICWRLRSEVVVGFGDPELMVETYGEVVLAEADPETFVPLDDLTPEIFQGWVNAPADAGGPTKSEANEATLAVMDADPAESNFRVAAFSEADSELTFEPLPE